MTLARRCGAGLAGLIALGCCASALAQATASAWPAKPVRVVVPLAAGSAVDNAARILLQKVGDSLGQTFTIENQPGAAGLIGAERVARAAPDGYLLGGFNDSIMTMLPHMEPKPSWDIVRDFTPITLAATIDWGLVVGTQARVNTVGDLIARAKAAPGEIDYGTGGNGSPQHIGMALLATRAGITLTHVPYKGASQAAVGVAGGEVTAALQGIATVYSLVRAGKLRLIGVATRTRLAAFPDTPTLAESGLPGFEFNSWFTLMGPHGLPRSIVTTLRNEVVRALADPTVREKLVAQGLTPQGSTPEELAQATQAQLTRYGELMRHMGL
jgi:tripartite-type tricarboxylate transporter receptor subunit TctC